MMASQTTLQENIVELQRYIDTDQTPQNSRPKIQRVPQYLRNRKKFEEHYTPKLVSIGPIHHGNTDLKLGEKYKLMWAAEYIKNTGSTQKDLHKKIVDNIDELKGHFRDDVFNLTGESLKGYHSLEEKLSWMLFVDGCSLLYILEKLKVYETSHMHIKHDHMVLVRMDVLLLENQLPYRVVKLLWQDDNESGLKNTMRKFLIWNGWVSRSEMEEEGHHSVSITNESQSETPTHLLDLMYKLNLTSKTRSNEAKEAAEEEAAKKWSQQIKISSQKKYSKEDEITYTGIEDLTAVGIILKPTLRCRPADIYYSEGWFTVKLTIPTISVNNFTAATFLNLIAYEMSPDFESDYEICSYVAFMDSLIDHPEDVKVLRSNGILYTFWSNEEVAKLFNTMGTDLVDYDINTFELRIILEERYRKKYKTWIALGFRTYFNNPWAVIAFVPAFIALALTFIQTWFAVHPASNKEQQIGHKIYPLESVHWSMFDLSHPTAQLRFWGMYF